MKARRNNKPPAPLRMTRQRRLILAEFRRPGRHLTADEVYARIRRRLANISLGTVYRNLEILSQAGRIKKLHIGGGQKQYDGGLHPHYHIRCIRCGRISDVPAEPFGDLEATAGKTSKFRISGHQLEFEGLCPICRKRVNRKK